MKPNGIQEERLRALFREMVDIYSPSGKEEEIVEYAGAYLEKRGFDVVYQPVEKTRRNIIIPGVEDAQLLFIGHLDTVSASDFDHYEYQEREGSIYGLGASDMKGGCAAMIEAFCAYRERADAPLPAALALVVGEEETGDGAQALLEDYHFPWAVVGEPTGLRPCFDHYGYLEFILTTTGRRVHASQASGADNAVFSMLTALLRISDHCREKREEVIFNIRDLTSAHAGFAVPDRCEAWIDLHVPSRYPMEELIWEIEDLTRALARPGNGGMIGIECNTIHRGYSLPEKGIIAELLRSVYGRRDIPWETGAFVSDSDAVHLWQNGIKPVVLGPGRLETAHTNDEHVDFGEVAEAARVYLGLLDLLGAS